MHNSQGSFYALGANIDAGDTINWNGGLGFMPVSVGGAFDGLGHVVSNLTINRPLVSAVGMINATYHSAPVSNFGLSGGSITGDFFVGGLIGMASVGGSVRNSFSSAVVVGNRNVGGLVGYSPGSLIITTSYNNGAVTGYTNVGGLVGRSDAGLLLSKSFNLGLITATAPPVFFYGNAGGIVGSASGANIVDVFNVGRVQSTNSAAVIGGIVGDSTEISYIQRSYNTGVISGRQHTGGIAGFNRNGSHILDSYNRGNVSAEYSSGGIVGYNYAGTITNSYNTGAITSGDGTAGAIVGSNYLGFIFDSYWNSDVASRGTYYGSPNWGSYNLEGVAQNVRALSSDAMKESQNYTATLNGGTPLWDFNIWYATGSSAPLLRSSPFVATANFGQVQTYGSVNTSQAVTYANMWGNDSLIVSGLNLNTNATVTSGVGNYAITGSGASATNLATGLNYYFIYSPGTLTINQRPLTVTAEPKTKNYGEVNPALSYSVAADGVGTSRGLVNADTLSGSLTTTANQASGAGSYTIDASALSNGNYLVTANNGTLTINKAHLTVTANNAIKTYGDANPVLGTTVSGFVNGETLATSGVSGSGAASTSANATTGAGSATITAAAGTLAASNYDFTNLVNGTLTINKAPLTVTANNAIKTYGDANPVLGTTVSGFVNGETLATSGVSGSGAASTTANATTGAGSATITAAAGTLAASNYDFTNLVNGTLTINKAPLTVTANNAIKTYGDANPVLGTTVSGFVNGETLATSGVSGTGAASTSANATTGAGSATITAAAGTLAASNYNFTNLVNGTLTINKAPLTVTANNAIKNYGDANPVLEHDGEWLCQWHETLATSGVSGSGAASTTVQMQQRGAGSATSQRQRVRWRLATTTSPTW
jgi:trimeric autotransporter adhesin